jgi:hypothetical protein
MPPFFRPAYQSLSRFGFGGATVLLAYRGRQVSFNTTVHGNGVVLLKDKLLDQLNLIIQNFTNVHRPVQHIRIQ